jgi:DNA-binding winged helix-turn-helix (wHTH) protein
VPASAEPRPGVRFRFGAFVISPGRRELRCGDAEVRLIPRYFDLLVLLVTCRDRAVHRQEIFDRVWSDVIVSDGALSQAIRTLRRALGDDPREPRFIRTVSRHGYQFVHAGVVEEPDVPSQAAPAGVSPHPWPADETSDDAPGRAAPLTPPGDLGRRELVARVLAHAPGRPPTDEERRDAAEQLHALGTEHALADIAGQPGEAEARAILRDARWDVPGAGPVPLVGSHGALAAVAALVRLRLRRAASLASRRWAAASGGGAMAGTIAGVIGGIALLLVPESMATPSVLVALGLVGAIAGAIGAAGVGAGLAAAEALARSQRALGLIGCGAAGGALAGFLAHGVADAVLASMFGRDGAAIGGAVEGLVLGASAGCGYAAATTRLPGGGMATPHGGSRVAAALLTGACCAAAGIGLAMLDRHLVAASLDVVANRFEGSSVGLAPLARLLGEQELRPVTRTLVSAFEGLLFGMGVAFGLTRRPLLRQ